jgi:uncharacterized RDD family membrane protein YckC
MIHCRKFAPWKVRPASTPSAMRVAAPPLAVAILAGVILAAVILAAVGIPLAVGILEAEGTPEEAATPAALDTKLAVIPALIPAIPEAAIAVGCPGAQVTIWKTIPNCSR